MLFVAGEGTESKVKKAFEEPKVESYSLEEIVVDTAFTGDHSKEV